MTVFEPVSEWGLAGICELHQQTLRLLSFEEMPKKIFGAQVAFNLLSRSVPDCKPGISEIRERVGRHVRGVMSNLAPQPAVRVMQAPVFFSHTICGYIKLSKPVPAAELQAALDVRPLKVFPNPVEQPTAVGTAGINEIALGAVERDEASEAGFWVWAVLDNVRWAAQIAAEIAAELDSALIPPQTDRN